MLNEEPVLGTVDWQICSSAELVPADMLELLVLLAKPEVGVGGHDPVVLREVLQLHWSRSFNDRVRETDKVCRVVSTDTVMTARFGTGIAAEFAKYNKGKEDKDKDYDGDGDADQDCRVVRVGADSLAPSSL